MSALSKSNGSSVGGQKQIKRLQHPLLLYAFIVAAGVIIVSMLVYSYTSGLNMTKRFGELIHTSDELQLSITTGHLWFEEILAGDRNEEIEIVRQKYDEGEKHANVLRDGGAGILGEIEATDDEEILQLSEEIIRDLERFKKITSLRYQQYPSAGPGSEIDQQYDSLFNEISDKSTRIKNRLYALIQRNIRDFSVIHIVLILAAILLTLSVLILLFRNTQRRIKHFATIDNLNVELEKRIKDTLIKSRDLETFDYLVSNALRAPIRQSEELGRILVRGETEKLKLPIEEVINRIIESNRTTRDMLDGLLILSRASRSELAFEEVNLSNIAKSQWNLLTASDLKRKIHFKTVEDIVESCDPQLISIVLRNLLENAWKFTFNNEEPIVEFNVNVSRNNNVYYVKDNGIGFERHRSSKIFEPFHSFHTDSNFSGNGLGLATARRIITRHGGKIWAESEPGDGATFYFTIESHKANNRIKTAS